MLNDTVIITRKVQLFIDNADPEKRLLHYQKLFSWQDLVYRGSNLVLTHQYIQENIKDFIYLQDNIKVRLADTASDESGILNTSRLNSTYKVLSNYFKGKIPSDILSNLNVALIKTFNTDRTAYWKGEKSLRNFKKDMPIPFSGKQLKIDAEDNSRDFKIRIFKIPFRTYLGKDRTDKRLLIQQAVAGEIKVCGSSLKIIKGRIFLLLALEVPKRKYALKEDLIAKASLSVEYPIKLHVAKRNYQIGSKEEFTHRRLAIQAARHRLQRAVPFNNGGKGKKKKLKTIDQYKEKEKNYIDSRLHLYSRKLIDMCIKSQAGTLLLTKQMHEQPDLNPTELLLKNWNYYGFLDKIQYKANMAGINVIIE